MTDDAFANTAPSSTRRHQNTAISAWDPFRIEFKTSPGIEMTQRGKLASTG